MYIDRVFHTSSTDMFQIPSNTIAMTITSPPYNVGIEYGGDKTSDQIPWDEYWAMMEQVFSEVYRVTLNGGRVAINIANTGRNPYIPMSSYFNVMMLRLGFWMRGEVIWQKGDAPNNSCAWGSWCSPSNPVLRDMHEYLLIYNKGPAGRQESGTATITDEEFKALTGSVWRFNPSTSKQRKEHPAPFPSELPERLIKLYTFAGDTVLDPFSGSGTTLHTAKLLDRHYTGYELIYEYWERAVQKVTELRPGNGTDTLPPTKIIKVKKERKKRTA